MKRKIKELEKNEQEINEQETDEPETDEPETDEPETKKQKTNEQEIDDICPICMNDICKVNYVITKCNHKFLFRLSM